MSEAPSLRVRLPTMNVLLVSEIGVSVQTAQPSPLRTAFRTAVTKPEFIAASVLVPVPTGKLLSKVQVSSAIVPPWL